MLHKGVGLCAALEGGWQATGTLGCMAATRNGSIVSLGLDADVRKICKVSLGLVAVTKRALARAAALAAPLWRFSSSSALANSLASRVIL